MKTYEFRDPVHGFINLDEWELALVNHRVFQRLRRINQLGFTSMVYPGANHTRFEHSIGVMHVATRMFENIVQRSKDLLFKELKYDDAGIKRDKRIVRLAALLHDVGHTPFSHAGESVMPFIEENKRYEHEDYSAAMIRLLMKDVIESHPLNENYRITADDIADLIEGNAKCGRRIVWRDLISSQLDADRADYLLRDSHHLGVNYGKYDLNRLLVTLKLEKIPEQDNYRLAFKSGGLHAVEALIIARYMMFTQVYFQHARRAYDFHYSKALEHILKKMEGEPLFPPPDTKENLYKYLTWDDWKVGGLIHQIVEENLHAKAIIERQHYKVVFETGEQPNAEDTLKAEEAQDVLTDNEIEYHADSAESVWYKFENKEIYVEDVKRKPRKLSELSSVVSGLKRLKKIRIYTSGKNKQNALSLIEGRE